MNSISTFFFTLLLTLTLWPHQTLASSEVSNGHDFITKTCDHTTYKDLCKASLQSVPLASHDDLHDLALLALKIASANASDISDLINKLLNATLDEPFMQQCLTDCSENYIDAIDQIEDSIVALDSKAYNDINMWVTAAMSDADACEEGFNDQPGHKSPLTPFNTVFSQLCSNALAITNLLAGP